MAIPLPIVSSQAKPRADAPGAVSYTHLDVYKRQHVTFGRDDEHDVEAAGGKTGQAVDARIVVAVFEAFVGGDWNAE